MKIQVEVPNDLDLTGVDLSAFFAAELAKRGPSLVRRAKMEAARAPVLAAREAVKKAKPEERAAAHAALRAAMEQERAKRKEIVVKPEAPKGKPN